MNRVHLFLGKTSEKKKEKRREEKEHFRVFSSRVLFVHDGRPSSRPFFLFFHLQITVTIYKIAYEIII